MVPSNELDKNSLFVGDISIHETFLVCPFNYLKIFLLSIISQTKIFPSSDPECN
jgi:hypothetical protein